MEQLIKTIWTSTSEEFISYLLFGTLMISVIIQILKD